MPKQMNAWACTYTHGQIWHTQTHANHPTCITVSALFCKAPGGWHTALKGNQKPSWCCYWYFSHDFVQYLSHWTPQGRTIWKTLLTLATEGICFSVATFPRSLWGGEELPVLPAHCSSGVLSHQDFKGIKDHLPFLKFWKNSLYNSTDVQC